MIIDLKYYPLVFRTSQRGVECIAQTVTEQVEAQHQEADEYRGEENDMGISEKEVISLCKKCTDTGHGTGIQVNNSKVRQTGLRENNAGDNENTAGDKSTDSVGENVLEHNAAVVCAESSCNENVFLILEAVELHSGSCRRADPAGKEERDEQYQRM